MRNHLVPVNENATSPFDVIKNINPETGMEFWSARDLMPLMGYDKWERFAGAVERARTSIEVQGMNPDAEASRLREPSGRTNQLRDNYHLSRFAAYLVAMNGDPRKPEVAAAQAYFAIKTRESETAQTFDPASLTRREILEMALDSEQRALEAEAEVKALTGGSGMRIKDFIKTYFTEPGERIIFEWFYTHGYLIDGRIYNKNGTARRNANGTGPLLRWDHMHPSYRGRTYFTLIPRSTQNPHGGKRTRIIPERQLDLVALLLSAPDLDVRMTREGRQAVDELNGISPNQYRLTAGS